MSRFVAAANNMRGGSFCFLRQIAIRTGSVAAGFMHVHVSPRSGLSCHRCDRQRGSLLQGQCGVLHIACQCKKNIWVLEHIIASQRESFTS